METLSSESSIQQHISTCIDSFLEGFRPPPEFTIDEWSDEYRKLPQESSDESGQWRTSRTPYLREPMQELSPKSHAEDIVFMKGSQLGVTETIVNTILFYITHAPCPILAIYPTITVAERTSKQRIQPSINLCDPAFEKVGSPKSRTTGNTTFEKDFPGGTLIIGGANSAASLRSMPVKICLFDEEDGYPEDVDGEGDPVELGERRTTNFSRKKRYHVSTPTLSETSRITKRFETSDQRFFYVPCPHCHEKQIIKWENFKFENRDPDTVRLICISCKREIYEHYKTWMLEHGEWRKHNPSSKIPGFHLSALYSPLGWFSWREVVQKHIEAIGNRNKRKTWVNTVLGEPWADEGFSIEAHHLMKRREKYGAPVPAGVLVLVNGVDTQDNRLESTTVGIGWNGGIEIWIIDHAVFIGNPAQPTVWQLLDQYLMKSWKHESGAHMNVAATGIDAMGHFTDEVYKFCSAREYRRVFPMQGRGGAGRPLVIRGNRNKKHRVFIFQVGDDTAKASIYHRLLIEQNGPGKIHFPMHLEEEYFKQLTSESRLTRQKSGLPKVQWVLPEGRRNETLDCLKYGLAALQVLNPNLELLAEENQIFQSDFSQPTQRRHRRLRSKGVEV